MKKIFSLVAIAAVAATMFTSCKNNDDPTPEKPKAKLTLSVDKPAIDVAGKGAFKVTSDIAAPEAIVISVTSSDDKILTIDPASVTIAKDGKEITGTYTGVAEGKAKIKIATSTKNVSVTVAEVEVTVGTPPAPGAKIEKLVVVPAGWEDGNGFLVHTEDETTVSFNFFERDGISMDFYSSESKEMPMGMGILQQQGDSADQTGISLTPVAEGTAITLNAMVASPWGFFQTVYTAEHSVLATGKDVFIVVACGDGSSTSAAYRAWIKINLGTDGTWSSLNIVEGYVCLDESEFKVGQKQ